MDKLIALTGSVPSNFSTVAVTSREAEALPTCRGVSVAEPMSFLLRFFFRVKGRPPVSFQQKRERVQE